MTGKPPAMAFKRRPSNGSPVWVNQRLAVMATITAEPSGKIKKRRCKVKVDAKTPGMPPAAGPGFWRWGFFNASWESMPSGHGQSQLAMPIESPVNA
ncbi:MAG: hypothetical protein JEZ11_19445 [Desulfobacterales bacterium]|nr:hypothetical protein [Desulfobacterales bacterium]